MNSSSSETFQIQGGGLDQSAAGRRSPTTNYGNHVTALQHEFYYHALSTAMGTGTQQQQQQQQVVAGWPAGGTANRVLNGPGQQRTGPFGQHWQPAAAADTNGGGSMVAPASADYGREQQVWCGPGSSYTLPPTNGLAEAPNVFPSLGATTSVNGLATHGAGPQYQPPYQQDQQLLFQQAFTQQQHQQLEQPPFGTASTARNPTAVVFPCATAQHPSPFVTNGEINASIVAAGRVNGAEGVTAGVPVGIGADGGNGDGPVFAASPFVLANDGELNAVGNGNGTGSPVSTSASTDGMGTAVGVAAAASGGGADVQADQVFSPEAIHDGVAKHTGQQSSALLSPLTAAPPQQQQQLLPSTYALYQCQLQRAPVFTTSTTDVFTPTPNNFIGPQNMLTGGGGVGGSGGQMMHTAAAAAGGGSPCVPFPVLSFLQLNPLYPGLKNLVQSPPVFAVDDFFTHAECDALITLAGNYMVLSPVVGAGAGELSESRTSSSCFLAREDLPTVCSKVMALTGKPLEHLELPQVGRYYTSQKYANHWDAFDLGTEDGRRFAQNGGQRVCTVLVYLNDVIVGGCTSFPRLGLRVQPKKGMAIVFFPATLDGTLDPMVLHAAEPAVDTKWVSQIWIRQGTYHGTPTARIPQI